MQGAVLNQQGGNGALALIQAGFHNGTLGAAVGVGFQLHDLCFQNNAFQQVLDACASSSRHGDAGSFAAPVFGHDLVLGQLFLHALRVSGRLIHLVDGNDQLDVGSLSVVDGLDGLGHDAVIGSNDQNRDIGHIRAAGTHGGKGFVARRIQEGNGAAVDIDLVSADGLGNAAGFACGNVSGTDAVQDGSFAVVNVAHNNNDRRTFDQLIGAVLFLGEQALFDRNMNFMLHLCVEFLCDQGGGIKIDHIGSSVHFAHLHELGNNLGHVLLQAGSQLANSDLIGDGDFELGVAGLFQLDALQALGFGFTAAAKLLAAAVIAVVELFFFAGGGVLALAGHIAAVGQVIIACAELIHVHIHGAGIHRHLGAVNLDLLGGDGLLDAGLAGQLLHRHALFAALFGLLVIIALFIALFLLDRFGLCCLGLRILGGLGLLRFRLCLGGFRLLGLLGLGLSGLRLRRFFFRLGLCFGLFGLLLDGLRLLAGCQILAQVLDGGFAGQGFHQGVDLVFFKGRARLAGLAGQLRKSLDNPFGADAKIFCNIRNFVFEINHWLNPPSLAF